MAQKQNAHQNNIHPVGPPIEVASNNWFTVEQQPVDITDPLTGTVKNSAVDGAQMNYLKIRTPGVLVVADLGRKAVLLMDQERYTTNLVEGRPVRHYELPGGGLDGSEDEAGIKAAAERELEEEVGYGAQDYILLGSKNRGLLAHPYVVDHNYTVLARGAEPHPNGPKHGVDEVLGQPEQFTWPEAHEMYLSENGLRKPGEGGPKVISSAPTVAGLSMAEQWLRRHDELGPKSF